MPNALPRYLKVLFLTTVLVSIPFFLNLLFLFQTNELTPLPDLVQEQVSRHALYGSAYLDSSWSALLLASVVKPDVMVLGSSRVVGFRGDAITVPFMNAGVAVHSVREGQLFIDRLFAYNQPKVILLGLDPFCLVHSLRIPIAFF